MPVLSWPAVLRLVVAAVLGISIWTAALPGPSTQAGAALAAAGAGLQLPAQWADALRARVNLLADEYDLALRRLYHLPT